MINYIIIFCSLGILAASLLFFEGVNYINSELNNSGDLTLRNRDEYELMRHRDPLTGKIPENIRRLEMEYASKLPGFYRSLKTGNDEIQSIEWTRRGPYNIGGRTRALAIDISNENIILAGGVSGGLWRSTDGGNTWTKTSKPDQLHSVSCIIQDTRSGRENVWYAGSGEWYGNSARIYGDGIYKSTDGGLSWEILLSTSTSKPQIWDNRFDFIWNLAMNPASISEDGELYAAVVGSIMKSTDGGNTWKSVLGGFGNSYSQFTDIAISRSGILYAAMSEEALNTTSQVKGLFRSTDGDNWIEITPLDMPGKYRRVVVAIAPSDENRVYFAGETPGSGIITYNIYGDTLWHSFWKYDYISGDGSRSGGFWENRTMNLPAPSYWRGGINSQNSYNLVLSVKPDDPDVVILGATNLYVSKDGFKSGSYNWIGGYCPDYYECPLFSMYSNHHPDLHALVFSRSNSNILYTGSDGGIHKTLDVMADSVVWLSLNNGYYTTQFYTIAIDHSTGGSSVILGGLQDNGTLFTNSIDTANFWTMPTFGDGMTCFIEDGGKTYYTSQNASSPVRVKMWRLKIGDDGWPTIRNRIDPAGGLDFIWNSFFGLDPNDRNRMYLGGGKILWRNNNLSDIPFVESNDSTMINWDSLTMSRIDLTNPIVKRATASTVITAGDISTHPANIVYYGTSLGEVFKIENAQEGNPQPVNVTSSKFTLNAFVSCIKIDPDNADTVFVVFSNYNVQSIFMTANGGIDWEPVSGNLEETTGGSGNGPACHWIDILKVGDKKIYFVGASTGLYSSTNIDGMFTVWKQEASKEIGNVVVNMIDTRDSDNFVAVGTHGAGVFTTKYTELPSKPPAPQLLSPANKTRGVKDYQLLQWHALANASFYSIEISRDENFNDIIFFQDGIRGTSYNYGVIEEGLKDYYWRVRARNSAGPGNYSDAWEFTSVIGTPILAYPENKADSILLNVQFRWNPVQGAKRYHLRISKNFTFTNLIVDRQDISVPLYEVNSLEEGTKYFWNVKAIDDDGISKESSKWYFTTISYTRVETAYDYTKSLVVFQNFPNPFNTNTKVKIINLTNQRVVIKLYNYSGVLIKTLCDAYLNGGEYIFGINASEFAAGRYFYVVEYENKKEFWNFTVF